MLSKLINIAIVDTHTLFRKTLKNYISDQRNMNVVIQSPNISDLLSKLKDFEVHILLMEVYVPEQNGVDAVKNIKSKYPDIKILALSTCTEMNSLNELLDAGVYGIISKTDEPDELIRAIEAISEKGIYRSALFTEIMYWNKQHNLMSNKETTTVSLNKRESEMLQLLWEEKSNKEIAGYLYLSVRSVEKIRQDLKEKLGVKSTIGLIKYGINKKIIKVTSPVYTKWLQP
ncbi:DNA-binding response regulator [Niastella koreensis]|uniref:Two component transcriptional regulator, LuxR family n=2 Tax=Niastella koreensis TaxID=354356 RepID=G8TKI8_NIAKG|nr:response regulator transcription factor [Niastella koreensis]AEV98662.1 two component transcriptional regulator, LuxR family [Niastella koreensis GR20-10]OQP44398.1 DNA-binding response regulator [Niastella koreensis]